MVVTPSRKFVIPGFCRKPDARERAAISPAEQGGVGFGGTSRRGGGGEEGTCGGLCLRPRLKLRRRLTGTETVDMCTVRVTVIIPRPIAICERPSGGRQALPPASRRAPEHPGDSERRARRQAELMIDAAGRFSSESMAKTVQAGILVDGESESERRKARMRAHGRLEMVGVDGR